MRKNAPLLIALFLATATLAPAVDFGFGLQVDDEGRKSFYLAVSNHYQVPEKEIVVVRERHIPDEEMPVVFFLAARCNASPATIIDLRLGGKSWMDITLQFGKTAEIFYVPVEDVSDPPYGHAYGHFKKHPKNRWGEIRLSDDDVVNFVNLKFICDHYGWTPNEVIRMRQDGRGFIDINRDIKDRKAGAKTQASTGSKDQPAKNKGKGKDKQK